MILDSEPRSVFADHSRLLFDNIPFPAWVFDAATLAMLDVNPAALIAYGYSREEFLSLTIKDIRPSEDVPALLETLAKAGDHTDIAALRRHRRKDGTLIDVEATSHPMVYDEKPARLVVAIDVAKRLTFERKLQFSEDRFRLFVSAVKDYAILMLDPQGRIVSWNPGAERITGYRETEIVGQHFSRFYPPEDLEQGKPECELKIASEEGRFEDEGWRVRKDGSRFWANVMITALRDESGQLCGFGKVTRDMTEQKRNEEQLRFQNAQLLVANNELEAFSYSVSHDLRAPLRSINGFSQALLEDCADKLSHTEKEHLQRIRAATQRMSVLIDDLLNLSRVARAEIHREKISLSALANSIAAELRRNGPERTVDFRIEDGMEADGDLRLLHVVLENLLSNAWKFTSKRSSAHIEFGRDKQNGKCAYFVRDDGAGFDPAYAGKLFGAFQRLHALTDFPGTGVGLATVRRIIHRHGGEIWASGAIDQGATFHFTL